MSDLLRAVFGKKNYTPPPETSQHQPTNAVVMRCSQCGHETLHHAVLDPASRSSSSPGRIKPHAQIGPTESLNDLAQVAGIIAVPTRITPDPNSPLNQHLRLIEHLQTLFTKTNAILTNLTSSQEEYEEAILTMNKGLTDLKFGPIEDPHPNPLSGRTRLHYAMEFNCQAVAKNLITAHEALAIIPCKLTTPYNETPLIFWPSHALFQRDSKDFLKFYLDIIIKNINSLIPEIKLDFRNALFEPLMRKLIPAYHVHSQIIEEFVQALLEFGPYTYRTKNAEFRHESRPRYGKSPLYYATLYLALPLLKILIEKGKLDHRKVFYDTQLKVSPCTCLYILEHLDIMVAKEKPPYYNSLEKERSVREIKNYLLSC